MFSGFARILPGSIEYDGDDKIAVSDVRWLWCSGVYDYDNSWYVEHEGKSGTQHVGKTLSHSSVLLLAKRRSARSSHCSRRAHRSARRTGRTRSPDRKDNGGAALLAAEVR